MVVPGGMADRETEAGTFLMSGKMIARIPGVRFFLNAAVPYPENHMYVLCRRLVPLREMGK